MADTITIDEFAQRLHGLAAGRLRGILLRDVTAGALQAERRAKGMATTRLKRRSGRLAASIAGTATAVSDGVELRLRAGGRTGGDDVRYAGTQEFGATITPKRGKWLAIPVSPAVLTGAGVAKYLSARDAPLDLHFQHLAGGKAGLFDKNGLHYLLVKRVTIPPKHYLRDALDWTVPPLTDRIREHVRVAILTGDA